MRAHINTSVLVLTATFGLLGCQSGSASSTQSDQASAARQASDAEPISADAEYVVLHVSGLSCPLCATNLEKELHSQPAVSTVNVNLETGEVRVGLDGAFRPSRSDFKRIVVNSGFTLRGIDVPGEGA